MCMNRPIRRPAHIAARPVNTAANLDWEPRPSARRSAVSIVIWAAIIGLTLAVFRLECLFEEAGLGVL